MVKTAAVLLTALLATAAYAQDAPAPSRTAPSGTATGAVEFAPTQAVSASAPAPGVSVRQRSGNYAADSLASTPTSYNQIQTLGTFSSAHIAPIPAIREYLAGVSDNEALTDAYSPNSTAFTQLELYNQLEYFGARQFHFPIYYDPTGKTYQEHAGLAIVNETANLTTTDLKWSYPGWKIMDEPNFDFNSTCTTFATCLQNLKNWLVTTPNVAPITIYVEPTGYTYTPGGENATFAEALAASTSEDAPTSLAEPIDIITYEPFFQPWRDLENEIQGVFNYNEYFTIVTPDDIMGEEDTLKDAVFKDGYTLYPALENLRNRLIFVLTGDYVNNYLEYYPDLKNATLFVAEPYNDELNFTDSTLFVDVLGSLDGVETTAAPVSATARSAISSQVEQINDAVTAGYMVRAAADWETYEARYNYSTRASDVMSSGAHFVQTTFPTTPTLFPSTYSIALPIRGNQKQSTRCNPKTSGGVIFNATEIYTTGCPRPNNLTPSLAPTEATSSRKLLL